MPKPEEPPTKGGPGDPPTDAPVTPPAKVEITYQGKKYLVEPEVAEVYQSREKEFQQKVSEHSDELGQLRRYRQSSEDEKRRANRPSQEPSFDEALEQAWYENPRAAYQMMRQEITKDLSGQYQHQEALKDFWTGFYRNHSDLQEDDFLVKAVFSERFSSLADLTPRKAQDELADMTRKEILRFTRKAKTDGAGSRTRTEEASGERRTPEKTPEEIEEEQGPKSLSDVIRNRAKARKAGPSRTRTE